jgi:hypothetical protein
MSRVFSQIEVKETGALAHIPDISIFELRASKIRRLLGQGQGLRSIH